MEVLIETQPELAAVGPRVDDVGLVLDLAGAGVAILGLMCLAKVASTGPANDSPAVLVSYVAGGLAGCGLAIAGRG